MNFIVRLSHPTDVWGREPNLNHGTESKKKKLECLQIYFFWTWFVDQYDWTVWYQFEWSWFHSKSQFHEKAKSVLIFWPIFNQFGWHLMCCHSLLFCWISLIHFAWSNCKGEMLTYVIFLAIHLYTGLHFDISMKQLLSNLVWWQTKLNFVHLIPVQISWLLLNFKVARKLEHVIILV